MIVSKKKGKKFDQQSYDSLFDNIEYNLREMGFGDVTVNKKMKDLNKILYDILLKINQADAVKFKINYNLIFKYFRDLNNPKSEEFQEFENYFTNFYNFCFELPQDNMIRETIKFRGNNGST